MKKWVVVFLIIICILLIITAFSLIKTNKENAKVGGGTIAGNIIEEDNKNVVTGEIIGGNIGANAGESSGGSSGGGAGGGSGGAGGGASSGVSSVGSAGTEEEAANETNNGEIIGKDIELPEDVNEVNCGFYFAGYGVCAGKCPSGTCVSEGRSCYCKN